MTKRIAIPFKDTQLRVIGPTGSFLARRIQRLDMPANLPNTVLNELGNAGHLGTITDIPEVTSTFQAFDATHELYSYLTGTDPTNYPASGVDINQLGKVDLGVYVRQESTAQNLKCIHLKKMQITGFTFTYSIDGESTEEYTAAGSEKRYLKNDLIVDEVSSFPTSSQTLSQTPIVLKNGNKLISLIQDGEWKEETTDYSVSGTTVTLSGSATASLIAVYHADASSSYTYHTAAGLTGPAAIRGKNIPIYIDSNQIKRIQNVTIRGTFPNTKIMEMGNTSIVGYIVDPPEVSGDLTILSTDLENVNLLAQGSISGGAETEWGVDEYEERTLALKVQLKNPADNITITKTIKIPQMRITSDGTSSNVGDRMGETFGWMSSVGTCIIFSGEGLS